jgi:hypothetical protein
MYNSSGEKMNKDQEVSQILSEATAVVGDSIVELDDVVIVLEELTEMDIDDIESGDFPDDISTVSLAELVEFWLKNH